MKVLKDYYKISLTKLNLPNICISVHNQNHNFLKC